MRVDTTAVVGTVDAMTHPSNTNGQAHPPREVQPSGWSRLFKDTLTGALDCWTLDPEAASAGQVDLMTELQVLANQTSDWSDRNAVERLVRCAALADAVALVRYGICVAEISTSARISASSLKRHIRENRHHDCTPSLDGIPKRLLEAARQLETIPEEAANELSFVTSMVVGALR